MFMITTTHDQSDIPLDILLLWNMQMHKSKVVRIEMSRNTIKVSDTITTSWYENKVSVPA